VCRPPADDVQQRGSGADWWKEGHDGTSRSTVPRHDSWCVIAAVAFTSQLYLNYSRQTETRRVSCSYGPQYESNVEKAPVERHFVTLRKS